ncbi:MAG: protein-disulfide reductase DsbD family protein [Bryobacteraceae bacterium]|nr:protein-disulfide reductase DsbD family protein [Bryobacteraceae bacterium]
MARLWLASLLLAIASPLAAQPKNPARWTLTPSAQRLPPGAEFTAALRLELEEPWHMYSMTTPKGGPIITTIVLEESPAVAEWQIWYPAPQRKFDPNFQIDAETYEKTATFQFVIRLRPDAPAGEHELTARMRYQLCTDKECLPPRRVTASAKITIDPGAPAPPKAPLDGLKLFTPEAASSAAQAPSGKGPAASRQPAQPLGPFLLLAFGFGLAAVFTPCVFPMIPITMTFFLSQAGSSRFAVLRQALVFCLGIIILFTGIGLGLSAALGPFAVVQLGSNPWVNGFISLVFFVFGLSLLGAFELAIPASVLTRLNMASSRGGFLGTLLMGLTFTLAAFACVGPFMGTLLAASVTGDRMQPALGMLAFSAALSSPFFLLALFPSYLKKLPKSGGWMSRLKVVLGFLILAGMLKYLANVDQVLQWNLLTRERFLAFWVVLFALPGLYLLGWIPMEGVRRDEELKPGRLLAATLLLGFALSLLPGMFGARLGELEAYIPAPAEGFGLQGAARSEGARWLKNDWEAALQRAKAENRPILVAFTGYACTNCHWMKANMFPRPEVAAELARFVLIELYTDGTDAASEANQRRQQELFQTVAIPFYAIFSPEGSVIATFPGLTRNPQEFVAFLRKAG